MAAGGAAAYAVARVPDQRASRPWSTASSWLKYLSPFYYYAGHDPLGNGVDLADLAVLAAATAALIMIATLGFRRRDLRA